MKFTLLLLLYLNSAVQNGVEVQNEFALTARSSVGCFMV